MVWITRKVMGSRGRKVFNCCFWLSWVKRDILKFKINTFLLLAIFGACLFFFLLKPGIHLLLTDDQDERKPVPLGYADDVSRLNMTQVAETWILPVHAESPEQQLRQLILKAQKEGGKIAIAGARHSMGGHTLHPGGIVVDMLPWNKMTLDSEAKLLTVQAGALWKEVIAFLDKQGFSVSIMQSNHSFSVGGTLSVNAHGWQYGQPPVASSVQSFRLMMSDGEIVRCSRTENEALFSLALGGYGLFGIILDVELRVVANQRLQMTQYIVPSTDLLVELKQHADDNGRVQMVFARMNVAPDEFLQMMIINVFEQVAGDVPALTKPGLTGLKRAIFRGSVESAYGKSLRWFAETKIQRLLSGDIFSRNQLLNEGVEVFENRQAATRDILHEYFVPKDRANDFILALQKIIPQQKGDLLNVTVRAVNEDHDTFLRYAHEPMMAFVMLFSQDNSSQGEMKMKRLTQSLIDAAIMHGGRYYLPYRLHATDEQFSKAYPMGREFFDQKNRVDPNGLFQNTFYTRYGKQAATGQ